MATQSPHPASTIFALSSAPGRAGVAVIRISGPRAAAALEALAAPCPKPRVAAFRRVRDPRSRDLIDEALALYFPGPRSETGEDMAELQVHGGRAVIQATLHALGTLEGLRPARPGEFARRAFENGKLDLTAVEGLADLIDAETEAQRRQAVAQAGGLLGRLYDGWRERLIAAQGLVEAGIDFSDEADVGARTMSVARAQAAALLDDLRRHLAGAHRGEILRSGFRVVLAGPPNAGKSSLLNALARRDVAIVSEEAGTTRDVIEARLDLGGIAVIVSDTAGIREAGGAIEREGIRRTFARLGEADLVLWLTAPDVPGGDTPSAWPPEIAAVATSQRWDVATKADLAAPPHGVGAGAGNPQRHRVSVVSGEGLDGLTADIASAAAAAAGDIGDGPAPTQERHRIHLAEAESDLARFLAGGSADAELRAEDLRRAGVALGRLTGRIDPEDVLDRIFSRFCIGK